MDNHLVRYLLWFFSGYLQTDMVFQVHVKLAVPATYYSNIPQFLKPVTTKFMSHRHLEKCCRLKPF